MPIPCEPARPYWRSTERHPSVSVSSTCLTFQPPSSCGDLGSGSCATRAPSRVTVRLPTTDTLPIRKTSLNSPVARAAPDAKSTRPSAVTTTSVPRGGRVGAAAGARRRSGGTRSEEHTSELQSRENLVCRLLLEKKKNQRQQRRKNRTRDNHHRSQ